MYQDNLDANVRAFYTRNKPEKEATPKGELESTVMLSTLILALTSTSLLAFFIWTFTA